MRILRIIAGSSPEDGGPIEGLRLSGNFMSSVGHKTELVTIEDPQTEHISKFPFPVHACGPGTKPYGYTPKLADWVSDNAKQYDVAVIHGLWNHSSIGGWQGLKRAGMPYVVFTHGMMDPWFKTRYPVKHMAKQVFWSLWQGKVLRDAETVLFTSEEEKILARGVFSGHKYKEHVISYGANEPPIRSTEQTEAFYSLLPQLSQDKRYILFLSRIHEKKGCDLLVEAFAKFASQYSDVDLVIAGPDQTGLQSKLIEQSKQFGIKDRIHWPGMLKGHAKWGAFYGAEAFILPSHQENFGIVVAEAMSCGTPVLTTNKVNIWREVEASGGGFIQEDTLDGVIQLLENFLSLEKLRKDKMAKYARIGFESKFKASKAAKELENLLEQIVRDNNNVTSP